LPKLRLPAGESGKVGDGRPWYSIIVDGVHCHEHSVSIARAAHPDGLVLITDAMAASGLPPGEYTFGELRVEVRHGDKEVAAGGEFDDAL